MKRSVITLIASSLFMLIFSNCNAQPTIDIHYSGENAVAQIDVHSHMIPESYMGAVKAHGMEMDELYPIPSWNAEAHLEFMDAAGIRTSVLTMPAPQPYFGDAAESAAICRKFNEEAAALKARYPDRFIFCAALPLPDVDAAVAEAKYALEVLGADGVKLASNSYGQYLGDKELEPLMAYLNSMEAVIITHPHKPSAVNDKLVAAVPLASYEYLAETTRAILNMVAHNVLVRYPDLKVVVPHCGSFLPNALPRFKGLLPVMVSQGYMQPVDVDANISRLYFDLAGAATDDAIESLLTITEPSHILYGSDYPYVAAPALTGAKKALESRLAAHGLDPQAIFSDNAARLFGHIEPVDVKAAIERQLKDYPQTRVQDIYKSFCQDNLGPGHLIPNPQAARNYLMSELGTFREDLDNNRYEAPAVMYSPVGDEGNYVRVDLSVVLNGLVSEEVYLNAFVRSANEGRRATPEQWVAKWKLIEDVIRQYCPEIPDAEKDLEMIDAYVAKGDLIMHHSDAFGNAYNPHYRIIARDIFEKEIKPLIDL